MEHQVIVPFPVRRVWSALQEADRLARCVPGFTPDADSMPAPDEREPWAPVRLRGRLRMRVAGTSITYRGEARVVPDPADDEDGDARLLAVTADGEEVRGKGGAEARLVVRIEASEDVDWASSVTVSGTVSSAGGRLSDSPGGPRDSAGHRLLDRFMTAFVETMAEDDAEDESHHSERAGDAPSDAQLADELEGFADDLDAGPGPDGADEPIIEVPDSPAGLENLGAPPFEEGAGRAAEDAADSGEDAEDEDDEEDDDLDLPFPSEEFFESGEAPDPDELAAGLPPAGETASGTGRGPRRTMVGRSAEEVDHAPPRGRYAPVPVPVPDAARRDWRVVAVGAAGVVAATVIVYRVVKSRR